MHEEEHIVPRRPTGRPVPNYHGEEAPKIDNLNDDDYANYANMMGEGVDEDVPSPRIQSKAPNQNSDHGHCLEEDKRAR